MKSFQIDDGRRPASSQRFWLVYIVWCAAMLCAGTVKAADAPPAGESPTAIAQSLCNVLLEVMKKGPALDFNARVKVLDPELRRLYDMPLLTRLVVGPPWRGLSPEDQQTLVQVFSDYSTAVYASRFQSFSGEKFTVDPTPAAAANGDTIVHTKLVPHNSEAVELDYLMRQGPSGWRIIDVLLNGTISEMAERRSEYSSTLRDGGAAALIKLLRQKTDQLRS